MLVNIVRFPPVKPGMDAQFRAWFLWSTRVFAKHPGFVRRVLLRPRPGSEDLPIGEGYVAIVEHESHETFMAMHNSPEHAEVYARVEPLLAGKPTPAFYETVDAD